MSRKRKATTSLHHVSQTDELQSSVSSCQRSLQIRKLEALEMLNGTVMPRRFQFRDKEVQRFNNFLKDIFTKDEKIQHAYLKQHGFRFLMITGAPGAGKSLCANSILSKQQFDVIKLNANIVKTIRQVQDLIAERLLTHKDHKDRTMSTVQLIRALEDQKVYHNVLLYIQQIEILFHSSPDAISQDFLTLFAQKKLNIALVGISNTIDALQKYSHKFSFNINQIENIVFKPYSIEQTMDIMKQKLKMIEEKTDIVINFPIKLLRFSSTKIESLKKGDLRIVLAFLKEIVSECFAADTRQNTVEPYLVQSEYVHRILNKMIICKDNIMVTLPYQQKVLLLALFVYIKRTEALTVPLRMLQEDLKWVCECVKLDYCRKIIDDGLPELEQYSLIALSKKQGETRIMLKVSLNEIEASYGDNIIFKRFFDND